MFKKIVVGYDGSGSSQDAVRLAVLLKRTADARVTAVCVHGPARTTRINARTGEFEGTAADAERTLELLHDRVGEAVQCRSVPGLTVAHALRDVATEEDADLIVVGSTARARLSSTLAGSTADQLLQDSSRPVVVVPAGFAAGAVSKVGVPPRQRPRDRTINIRPPTATSDSPTPYQWGTGMCSRALVVVRGQQRVLRAGDLGQHLRARGLAVVSCGSTSSS